MKKEIINEKIFFFIEPIIIITIIIFIFIFKTLKLKIEIKLTGDANLTYEVFDKYEESGYKASLCYLKFCKDITKDVKVNNTLNMDKIGTYQIKYYLGKNQKAITAKRRINVVDTKEPVIELSNDKTITICPNNKNYKETEYTATDNYDGDITDKVIVTKTDNEITYEVKDSSNNETKVIQKIEIKDTKKPTITLKGNKTIYLELNEEYKEPGYTASDNCYGDLTESVNITNKLDITNYGTYKITYTVTDPSNNKTEVSRTVEVVKNKDIKVKLNELESYIKGLNHTTSVAFIDLDTKYEYYYNKDAIYFGASLIKTLDALYIYEKTEVSEENRELVKKAISVSHNPSHYQLMDNIGASTLKQFGINMGAKNTFKGDRVNGYTTLNDQIVYWKELYHFVNSSDPNASELKSYFLNDYVNCVQFDKSIPTMHKYGKYDNVFHDVGIVLDKHPYMIFVLTKNGTCKEIKKISSYAHEISVLLNK